MRRTIEHVLAATLILAPQPSPLRLEVEALHAELVAAFTADPGNAARFYTDSAGIVGGGRRSVGRQQVDGYWRSSPPGATLALEVLDVGGDPPNPWVRGRSTMQGSSGRRMVTEYIGLLERGKDGKLAFAVDAYASAPGGRAVDAREDEAAVRRADSTWARMYATHDTVAATQLYSENLLFIAANGRHKTRAEELGDIRPAAGLVMQYFRTQPSTVRTFESTAFVSGIAEWQYTVNGQPRSSRRTYTTIYVRGGPLGWRNVVTRMGAAP